MAEEKDIRDLKARVDICEAALEASGYLVWDEKQGRFIPPGTSEAPAKEKAK